MLRTTHVRSAISCAAVPIAANCCCCSIATQSCPILVQAALASVQPGTELIKVQLPGARLSVKEIKCGLDHVWTQVGTKGVPQAVSELFECQHMALIDYSSSEQLVALKVGNTLTELRSQQDGGAFTIRGRFL
eukprot:14530-Heterococcus_DN1.PRE.1